MKTLIAVLALFALALPAFADGGGPFFARSRQLVIQRNVVRQQVVRQKAVQQQVVVQKQVVQKVAVAQIVTPVVQLAQVYAAPAVYAPCGYTVPSAPVFFGPSAPTGLERAIRDLAEQQRDLAAQQERILKQLAPR